MDIKLTSKRPIVLVDDDHDFHFIFKRFYKRNNNVENVLVNLHSGSDCLDYLRNLEEGDPVPELILLDVNMPGMLGYECLKELRALSAFAEEPRVIMLSSSNYAKDVERAMQSGANQYIEKPYNMSELNFVCEA